MKKLFVKVLVPAVFTIFLIPQGALSNVYLEGMGMYNDAGDAEKMPGGGLSLGADFAGDFSFIGKYLMSTWTKYDQKDDKKKYAHAMLLGGIEYGYNFPVYRLVWRSGILLGASVTEINKELNNIEVTSLRETGYCFQLTTGIQWNLRQHVSPFLEIGYHKSFYYADLKDASIGGLQVFAGIRFSLFRVKRIDEDY